MANGGNGGGGGGGTKVEAVAADVSRSSTRVRHGRAARDTTSTTNNTNNANRIPRRSASTTGGGTENTTMIASNPKNSLTAARIKKESRSMATTARTVAKSADFGELTSRYTHRRHGLDHNDVQTDALTVRTVRMFHPVPCGHNTEYCYDRVAEDLTIVPATPLTDTVETPYGITSTQLRAVLANVRRRCLPRNGSIGNGCR